MEQAYAYRRADVLVVDKNQKPVIVVEVKAGTRQHPSDIEAHWEVLKDGAERLGARYILVVTPYKIVLWEREQPFDKPLLDLDTNVALRPYQIFGPNGIRSHLSLGVETKQWLQDLILRWHSPSPPYLHEMEESGVMDAIKDGDVLFEARL